METAKVHPLSDEYEPSNYSNDENLQTEKIGERAVAFQANSVGNESTEAPSSEAVSQALAKRDIISKRLLLGLLVIVLLVSMASMVLSLLAIRSCSRESSATGTANQPGKQH